MKYFFHIDCVCMFVSVERILHPEWKNKIVIVGEDTSRSVVSSADYEARSFGVKAGMPIYLAKQLLKGKDVIFSPVNIDKYVTFSHKFKEVITKYGKMESFCGIDECFLDPNIYMKNNNLTAVELANIIKLEVKQKVGLDLSIGISDRKWIAKFASSKFKNSIGEVYSNEVEKYWNDNVSKMLWIGEKTASKLKDYNIHTIGDLAKHDNYENLKAIFGKNWQIVHNKANGKNDFEEVDDTPWIAKSFSKSRTLIKDIEYNDIPEVKKLLNELSTIIYNDLLSKSAQARTINLTIKDNNFRTINRSLSLKYPTNEYYLIYTSALSLYYHEKSLKKIRLIGVSLSNLIY